MNDSLLNLKMWPKPESRDVGSYGSVELYAEALRMAQREGRITAALLGSKEEGVGARLRGLHIVKAPTKTIAEDLLRELRAYGWIQPSEGDAHCFKLTEAGENITRLLESDAAEFRRELLVKMHLRFRIPGWFVSRLFAINPQENGEVLLPAPLKDWKPESRDWEDCEWTEDLESQVMRSYKRATSALPQAFPVAPEDWIRQVRDEWDSSCQVRRRRVSRPKAKPDEKVKTYAPRGRLSRAMRAAAVELLFANTEPLRDVTDFPNAKHPIPPRSFQSWCPLLESLELIFYTDSHPNLPGRLIFPCSVFRRTTRDTRYIDISEIKDPQGRTLQLYSPEWSSDAGKLFVDELCKVYDSTKARTETLYVSLLDVRDEVCRRLRLSSTTFDEFLGKTIRQSFDFPKKTPFTVSTESDVRPAQQGGQGVFRRPVYLDTVPHSLIAISFAN